MKENEKIFFKMCWELRNEKYPWDVINVLSDKIPVKQMIYYVNKWERYGFYDWGTNILFGWFEEHKLPQQYKELIASEEG